VFKRGEVPLHQYDSRLIDAMNIYLGIDVGSVTTKLAALDGDDKWGGQCDMWDENLVGQGVK